MNFIERDVLSSVLKPAGILAAIPARSTLQEHSLVDTIGGNLAFSVPFNRITRESDFSVNRFIEGGSINEHTFLVMREVGASIQMSLAKELWESLHVDGSPWVDVQTGIPVPACSPHLVEYSDSPREPLIALSRSLRYRANVSALSPAEWIIAFHPVTWYEIAATWPSPWLMAQRQRQREWECSYCGTGHLPEEQNCTPGCGGSKETGWVCLYCGRSYSDNKQICWDGASGCGAISSLARVEDINGLSEALGGEFNEWVLHENKLPIDGFLYNTVTDVALRENDVWVIPTKVLGGVLVTKREWIDGRKTELPPHMTNRVFHTDDGEYLWSTEQEGWDMKLSVMTRQRMVCSTPQLLGKLTKRA